MHVAKVKAPVLQIAGKDDQCVPVSQAIQFHQALKEHGKESVLVMYPGEGHGISKFPAVVDMSTRVVEWFERYMAPS